jgi:hypothetical protein
VKPLFVGLNPSGALPDLTHCVSEYAFQIELYSSASVLFVQDETARRPVQNMTSNVCFIMVYPLLIIE